MNHPGYVFKGKTYKTVNGLLTSLAKDSGASEISMVVNNKITARSADRSTVVAVYNVTPPKFGETQVVTRAA